VTSRKSAAKAARRAKHAASCERKVRHGTQGAALAALHKLAESTGARTSQLRVYRCTACKTWHVGNSNGARY